MRTITVKGTGNVSARPDYIILSLNIEALSETYDRAMSEAAERIERLQGAAVCVGYHKEDLKTTSFDVQTGYENVKDRQGNYKREFVGYACSYRLKLAFDFDSKQLAKIISAIADCGLRCKAGTQYRIHCKKPISGQRKAADQRDGERQSEGGDSLQSIRQYAWAVAQHRLQLGRTQCFFQNKLRC